MVAQISVILTLLGLPSLVHGTHPIIRKEGEGSHLLIEPDGGENEMLRFQTQHKDKRTDFCAEDFPLGTPDTSECADDSHSLILRREECLDAAAKLGMPTGRTAGVATKLPFEIQHPSDQDKHPKGCFKDRDHDAIFYNPIGDLPTNQSVGGGTPVCHREKYKAGAAGTQTCPTDYTAILTEDACRTMATCRGSCVISEFRVGIAAPVTGTSQSKSSDERPLDAQDHYNDYPQGCFIKASDNCTYFNVPRNVTPSGPITGHRPMCVVLAASSTNATGSGSGST